MLGSRSNRVPSYPRYSLADLRSITVPDFKKFGPTTIKRLAETYNKLSEAVLKPLPEIETCDTRRGTGHHGSPANWDSTRKQSLQSGST